jgi:hypothetical protein
MQRNIPLHPSFFVPVFKTVQDGTLSRMEDFLRGIFVVFACPYSGNRREQRPLHSWYRHRIIAVEFLRPGENSAVANPPNFNHI